METRGFALLPLTFPIIFIRSSNFQSQRWSPVSLFWLWTACYFFSVLAFDKPLEFEHVAIGRHGPVPVRTEASRLEVESMQISPENSANGCRKVSSYPIESGAAKFGDTPHSHVQIDFSKRNLGNIFQDNFTLEMQFRTFYPNGVLLVIPVSISQICHVMSYSFKNISVTLHIRKKTFVPKSKQ